MRKLKSLVRFLRMLLFGFMLAICIVMGVAPVIPRRKEQVAIEVKMEETTEKENTTAVFNLFKKN